MLGKHNERHDRTTFRSRSFFVVAFFATAAAIIALASSYSHRRAVAQTRVAQFTLNKIATRAQDVNNLGWLAIQERDVTPESDGEVRAAKRELLETAAAVKRQTYHSRVIDETSSLLDNYMRVADHQWQLAEAGEFEAARRVDFEEVNPRLDALQSKISEASGAEDQWAEAIALRSRNELLVAAFLAAIAFLTLFLRFQRQKHGTQLAVAERNALQQSEERFRALTERSTDIVFITDASGRVKYASPSVKTVLALDAKAFLGTDLFDAVHADDRPMLKTTVSDITDQSPVVEFQLRHSDGQWVPFECVIRNLLEQRHIEGFVFNAREIAERKRAEAQLLFNATHDPLTGLPNRVLFLNRLQAVVDRMKRHPRQMAAVLFIDMDDLKVVNDCLGHAAGDELIAGFSNRLKGCMRREGAIARMGGDEFTVLLEDLTDPSDAVRVAQRIQSKLTKPFLVSNQEVFKSASIGIALVQENSSAEGVVQNADIAMYRAKSKGKACSEIFDAAMHEQVMGRLQLEARLRQALDNKELSLPYKPIVAVVPGAVEGFEALLRWRPTGADSVPPSVFIPAAEQSGLIVPISTWVLATGCLEALSWHRGNPTEPPLYVSVNVSARYFSHPSFIGDVRDSLRKSGIEPQYVKFELTESVAMNDAPSTEEIMSQIRALGVKLSIDDFGTGYSSLSYLRRFRVDTLKIDQSFVATMDVENDAIR